jgi:hypothetical protein
LERIRDSTPAVWSATSPDSERVVPAPEGSTLADTGDFVTDMNRAWNLVRAFIQSGSASHLGTWHEL